MIINGRLCAAGVSFLPPSLQAQVTFEMRSAEPTQLPFVVDSNTPAFWRDGNLYLYSSAGKPLISTFDA